MLNSKTKENVKVILIILGMLSMALTCLFILTKESNYVKAVDVNNQNNQTNSSYVTFDAGFGSSVDSISHSAVLDVDAQEPKLWLKLSTTAGGCKLYNPTFQFLTETGSYGINFDIGFGTVSLKDNSNKEFVKSSSKTNNTLNIIDLDGGLNAPLRLRPDFKNCAKTNQTCIIRFTGTVQDPSGNSTRVSKDIYVNVGWTANHGMELQQRASTYKRNDASKTLTIETTIQNQIKYGDSKYTLPVKQTQIVVDVPTYEGVAPTGVNVTATKTSATNGKDETNVVFNSSNWSYNSTNRKLTITVNNNPDSSGNIAYGRGVDEYVITYTYPQAAYDAFATGGTTIINKVVGTMTLYSNSSTIPVTKTINDNIRLDSEFGMDTDTSTKLGFYMNTFVGEKKWRTTIAGIYSLYHEDVTTVVGTRIEFGEMRYYSDTATYSGYDNANKKNYNPIIAIAISESSFKEYLGESGVAKIYDDNCQHLLGQITTSTPKNARGHYELTIPDEYQDSSHSIIVELSRPQANLKTIEIYHTREIYGGNFTLKQAQEITRGDAEFKTYVARTDDPTNFKPDDKPALIGDNLIFTDTYTDATLNVETQQLDATNPNLQELKLKLVLDNVKKVDCDAWNNPHFDFEFPSYIDNIENLSFSLKNSNNIAYDKDSNKAVIQKVGDNWHFFLSLDGNQQQNDTPTSLEITCNVKVNKFTPNTTENITVRYVNEAVRQYRNENNWLFTGGIFPGLPAGTKAGLASGTIDFINTPTLLCIAELTDYDGENTLNSIDNRNSTAEIARNKLITPTMNLKIQNNHTVPVSNLSILGRIPYTNNKYVIANADLGTNINTQMSKELTTTSTKNMTIYYSDNLNATKDVDLPANNWKINADDLSIVKSYLIVVNDTLNVGEQINLSYQFSVPAETNYNKNLYTSFGAYYNAGGTVLTCETDKIGLTTGARGKLNVTKTGTLLNGGTTAKEGDIIKYTIQIQNNSEHPVDNVMVNDRIPEHTSLIRLNEDGTYTKENIEAFSEEIGTINGHENKEYIFYVVVEEITENMNIENTATITAEGMEPELSNTSTIPAVTTVKEARLEVNKTSDIESGKTVKEGDIITYKITVRNTGNGAAKNVMVKDNIPEGTIYYDTETNTLKPSVKTINSEVKETLEPDESFEFTFKVQVGRVSVGKTITNTATVVGDNVEDTPSNTEGITAEVTVPKLRLEKKSSIEEGQVVKEGDTITYTITVYNEGTMPAYDVEIKDKVPEYTTYYENNKKDKEKVEVGKVISELKAGASESYTFTVIVGEIPENTEIKNTATVKGENGEEVQSDTVGVSAEISVPEMKLEKKSSIEKGKTIESGDIITYTIVATNTGKCIAHNVVISDKIPENTIYVEKMGDKYIKDESKKEITKEIESLEPGETATLTFNVMVGELSGNVQIRNTAKVNANNDGGGVESNTVGISAKPKDSGKTDGDLPYTGNYPLMIITSVGMIACTVFAIYEYKSLKRRK